MFFHRLSIIRVNSAACLWEIREKESHSWANLEKFQNFFRKISKIGDQLCLEKIFKNMKIRSGLKK
jgi:hypothetical protein